MGCVGTACRPPLRSATKSLPVLAPGYSLLRVLFELLIQRQQPFHVLARLARRYGPVVRLGRGSWQLLIVTHPDLIRRVLVLEAEDYSKDRGLDATQSLLGLGLLTSEGEFHKRQRRIQGDDCRGW